MNRNHISPCNHPESPLTGSTVEAMIDRTKALGLDYFAITDLGYMTSILKGYMYGQEEKVKIIAGVEIFFKDDNCEIVRGTQSEQIKYFKIIVHAKDQAAYQQIVKMCSDTRRKQISIGENNYGAFAWKDLIELAKYNITLTTSNVECMVSKHLLVGRADIGLKYYDKLRNIVGYDNFYPSIIPYKQDKYWSTTVQATLGNDKVVNIPAMDKIETDQNFKDATAIELARRGNKHTLLKAVFINKIKFNVSKQYQKIKSAKLINSFLDLPGGDIQTKANKFIIALANKFGDQDRLLINNYAYYSGKDDKIVQDMKLGDEKRVYQAQYMASTDDIREYMMTELGWVDHSIDHLIKHSQKWAENFKDFKLKYDYRLPTPEGDPLELLEKQIAKVGRMPKDDERYHKQYKEELELLTNNGVINLIPYFLPIVDVYDYYDQNGFLTGPGRGSAGGFLISYLLGITHIDPIKYELSSPRFLTMDRVKQGNLPDIDCDLESRVPLVGKDGSSGYLFNKYGNKAAQVSTRTLLRIKSAILDANRFFNNGVVNNEIAALSKGLDNTPQGVDDLEYVLGYEDDKGAWQDGLIDKNEDLKKYATERPEEWDLVKRALSLARQNSRHACFASDTLVDCGDDGVKYIKEEPTNTRNKKIKTWKVGDKETVIVTMNNGISIQCTPDHRFMIDGKEVEAKDLTGEIVNYQSFKKVHGSKSIENDEAFALGWFLNDGNYNKTKTLDSFDFYFTPQKDDEALSIIKKWAVKSGFKFTESKTRPGCYRTYHLPVFFQNTQKTYNKRLPSFFWKLTLESQKSFMRGLFSANGYCLKSRPFVGIKLTSKLLISDITVWLNANGIETSCGYSKPVDIVHKNGTYKSKSTVTLSIPHVTNKKSFKSLVGFEQEYKQKRLQEIINKAINTTYQPKAPTCLNVEKSGIAEVWDFNEPIDNVDFINGILVHNCAYLVADRDIEEIIPTFEVGGVRRITQPTAKQCEYAGLVKYDFLVISSLKDINLCMKYINKKHGDKGLKTGHFMHKGKNTYVWDLPQDTEIYDMLSSGATETVFQLNSAGSTPTVKKVKPTNIVDLATITSLERPGPKDFRDPKTGRNMVEEFIERKNGRSFADIPILQELIPETFGVLVFQEQITKIAKELGQMNVEDSENVRIGMGKKKKKLLDSLGPVFIAGAEKRTDPETAKKIWGMMETFARYGFNKSHAVAYVVVSFACAFFKYHYPLEWWAAVLSNADQKEINEVFYRYVKDMVLPPDINTSTEEMEVDYNLGKIRNKLSMISGIGEKAAEKIISKRPYSDITDFTRKKACGYAMTKKLIHVGALDSLFDKDEILFTKIQKYERAVKKVEFEEKLKAYDVKINAFVKENDQKSADRTHGLKLKYIEKGPAEPLSDEFYASLGFKHKLDYLVKKSIFPTMNLDLGAVLMKDSKKPILKGSRYDMVMDKWGKEILLVSGEHLQQIDGVDVTSDAKFCVPGYVIKAEEFTYQAGARKALKMIIDSSGYVSEKVLWPDYNSGKLIYPETLKEGCIAYFVYTKKPGKPYTNIFEIVVEEESIK